MTDELTASQVWHMYGHDPKARFIKKGGYSGHVESEYYRLLGLLDKIREERDALRTECERLTGNLLTALRDRDALRAKLEEQEEITEILVKDANAERDALRAKLEELEEVTKEQEIELEEERSRTPAGPGKPRYPGEY